MTAETRDSTAEKAAEPEMVTVECCDACEGNVPVPCSFMSHDMGPTEMRTVPADQVTRHRISPTTF